MRVEAPGHNADSARRRCRVCSTDTITSRSGFKNGAMCRTLALRSACTYSGTRFVYDFTAQTCNAENNISKPLFQTTTSMLPIHSRGDEVCHLANNFTCTSCATIQQHTHQVCLWTPPGKPLSLRQQGPNYQLIGGLAYLDVCSMVVLMPFLTPG